MAFAFPKSFERVMVVLLAVTPFLILVAPRVMAWWPAVLGLSAFLCADKDKPVLWLAACVPLWAGTLSLISTLWAAFPFETLNHAIDRLPFYYGLSLAIIGLSRMRDDVWQRILPFVSWVFAAGVIVIGVDQVLGHPIAHLYNTLNGEPDKFVRPAVNNRVLTGAVMLAVPALWTLWRRGHRVITTTSLCILLATLTISEASAAWLGLCAAILVFCAALWRPHWVQRAMMVTGAILIAAMPIIVGWVFDNRPDWNYLNSPSNGGRLEIWNFLSVMIDVRPILGYGYEVTRYFAMPQGMQFFEEASVLHPHNIPLQAWIEFGAVGACLMLAVWIAVMRRITSAPLLAMMTMICTISLLSFGMWQGTWLGLVLFCAFYWKAAATAFGTSIK